MATLLSNDLRRGIVRASVSPAASQTAIVITIPIDVADLASRGTVAIQCTVEQSPDGGATWFTLGGFGPTRLQAVAGQLHVNGQLFVNRQSGLPETTLRLTLEEEVRRADLVGDQATVHEWTLGDYQYKQFALLPTVRVSLDTFTVDGQGRRQADADLTYRADYEIDDRRRRL